MGVQRFLYILVPRDTFSVLLIPLAMFLVLAVILGTGLLLFFVVYIEYNCLECKLSWVREVRNFTRLRWACCCRTCMENADEEGDREVRDLGKREEFGKLIKDGGGGEKRLRVDEEGTKAVL
jgi:hypothetical protein